MDEKHGNYALGLIPGMKTAFSPKKYRAVTKKEEPALKSAVLSEQKAARTESARAVLFKILFQEEMRTLRRLISSKLPQRRSKG
ncbi:MAG TPA: hypothetical protein PLU75_07800 [Oscillospiraceae bacterium]|nr:hypothetical protein [Oscillospiraceae bacterium]HRW56145.1 hypothetical protein [Oscillospiraceae bacterium]